jgi:hypothetical protein
MADQTRQGAERRRGAMAAVSATSLFGDHGSQDQRPGPRPKAFSLVDAVLVGTGVGLAVASATFPWYVFLNPQAFGVAALNFDGQPLPADISGPFYTPSVQWSAVPIAMDDPAELPLDHSATGTARVDDQKASSVRRKVAIAAKGPLNFELVYVANGLAMIRDAAGLWIVRRGSVLPDNTVVMAIEQHSGGWTLRTSDNRVLELDHSR